MYLPPQSADSKRNGSESDEKQLACWLAVQILVKNDADLKAILDAWPRLPATLRGGIVAMVKSATRIQG